MKNITRNTLEKLTSIILGLLMNIFGANKYKNYIAVEPPAEATAQEAPNEETPAEEAPSESPEPSDEPSENDDTSEENL